MPQMSPLNWLNLLIVFSLTLKMMIIMNYFSFKHKKMDSKKMSNKKILLNWKW